MKRLPSPGGDAPRTALRSAQSPYPAGLSPADTLRERVASLKEIRPSPAPSAWLKWTPGR
ncbi:MAG: hypothetical protein KME57_31140 [Scytonema hyalinum WJT4-NPBG1]|nr:hypothetical protein [Scytonema hyalinum WJT4-NPBG1]